jgi:iron complex transport system substrate-binding protein
MGTAVLAGLVLAAPAERPEAAQAAVPSRIISLVPAVTEMLFAIGAGPAVVGVSNFDLYPPEAATRPKVGALVDPDFERILSLRPDLVVVYGSQAELIGRLARAGIGVYNYRHAGLADITQTIRAIGEQVGLANAGELLAAQIERDLDEVRRSVAGRPRPRTAIVFGREPGTLRSIYASAGVGFLHDMLELAGGDDVFGDVARESLLVSAETLLARAPDVIIEIEPAAEWSTARLQQELAVWRRLAAVPAVRTGRVHILAGDRRLVVPGPRVADASRVLAAALH